MKTITVLGATGSIGKSTLDIVGKHPDRYQIFALTANTSVDIMSDLCRRHNPQFAVMSNYDAAKKLKNALKDTRVEVLSGTESLSQVSGDASVDIVVAAIVGAVGLMPTLTAVRSSKRVLLANKEALVMAGDLFMKEVSHHQAELIPVDSEHNAIFQCLPENKKGDLSAKGVKRLVLTGSGGPFRDLDPNQFDRVTPEQAIAHPNWNMGPKISVDSATMMNKGLELIEASWLFDMDETEIDIVLHKESIIHSMVTYNDGSVLAQLGNPDMRTPIAHALAWPDRIESGVEPLNLIEVSQLNFEKVDNRRFPCIELARQCIRSSGTASTILNAANEVAVEAFLKQQIKFTDISKLIHQTLDKIPAQAAKDIENILEDDAASRRYVSSQISGSEFEVSL
ncbi:MAG: 1-deoxy-D-xylulose-5-phosphate reductoisomerase [Gammaproteobacteria bacterium]